LKVSLVILDFDGVVADTMGDLEELAVRVLMTYYGVSSSLARVLYLGTTGAPFAMQLEDMFGDNTKNIAAAREFAAAKAKLMTIARPFIDTREAVFQLRIKRGLKVGLCSSTVKELVDDFLDRWDLRQAHGFDWIGGLGMFERESKAFQIARCWTKLAIPRSETVFVGDSLRDIEYADLAGVSFIGLTSKPVFPAYRVRAINTLSQLPEVIGGMTDATPGNG
jgi:phosphoglycolate phosphatase-like HAD superfamily hydrolase